VVAIACVVVSLICAFGASRAGSASPALSTNGKIAFAGNQGVPSPPPRVILGPPPPPPPSFWGIYTINEDGTDLRRVSRNGGDYVSDPDWSADGTRIAFWSSRTPSHNPDIFVMNSDGTGETNLTNSNAMIALLRGRATDGSRSRASSTSG
jgi:hypothetical protein